MEKLDLSNIIEIGLIRQKLIHHPDLLSMFELLIIISNKRLNEEQVVVKMPIEPHTEPDLSSDSEDDVLA